MTERSRDDLLASISDARPAAPKNLPRNITFLAFTPPPPPPAVFASQVEMVMPGDTGTVELMITRALEQVSSLPPNHK